jgi:hypothetical protein
MVNSAELISTTEYLTPYPIYDINRCRFNWVGLYFVLSALELPDKGNSRAYVESTSRLEHYRILI